MAADPTWGDPLRVAVLHGQIECVRVLLSRAPVLLSHRVRGIGLLSLALSSNRVEIAEFLRSLGATLNVFELARSGDVPGLAAALDVDPALVNSVDPRGRTPLVHALEAGRGEAAVQLVLRGASPVPWQGQVCSAAEDALSRLTSQTWAAKRWSDLVRLRAEQTAAAAFQNLCATGADGMACMSSRVEHATIWRSPFGMSEVPSNELEGSYQPAAIAAKAHESGATALASGAWGAAARYFDEVLRLYVVSAATADKEAAAISSHNVAMSHYNLGRALVAGGWLKEAEPHVVAALEGLQVQQTRRQPGRNCTIVVEREPDGVVAARVVLALDLAATFQAREGKPVAARKTRKAAVALARERVPEPLILSDALIGLGGHEADQGALEDAEDAFREACNLREQVARKGCPTPTSADRASRYEESVTYRLCAERRGLGTMTADCHVDLATVYLQMGDQRGAEELLVRACEAYQGGVGNASALALALNNLAELRRRQGRLDEAGALLEKAAGAAAKLPADDPSMLIIGVTAAEIELDRGAAEAVAPSLEAASKRAIALLGQNDARVSMILTLLGRAQLAAGKLDGAEASFSRALALTVANGHRDLQWRAQVGLSRLLVRRKNTDAAILVGKQAVTTIQRLRNRLPNGRGGMQKAFLKDRTEAYRLLAALLLEVGRLDEALAVLELLKGEELHDFVRRRPGAAPAPASLSSTEAELPWQARYSKVERRLVTVAAEAKALRKALRLRNSRRSQSDSTRLAQLDGDLATAGQAFAAFVATVREYRRSVGPDRAAELGAKGLGRLQAFRTVLAKHPGTVAVHYLITDERLRIVVTTPDVVLVREHPAGAGEIGAQVKRLRRELENPNSDPRVAARQLYDVVLGPIVHDLEQAGADTLLLSLDGVLRYVPFASLHDGTRYLVERFQTVRLAEASRDKLHASSSVRWNLAGFGTTQAHEGLPALRGVRKELDAIVREGKRDRVGVVPGTITLDQRFTRAALADALHEDYSVLHLASHFVLEPGSWTDSYLLLGDGTHLTLADVNQEALAFGNVELVTLSACSTAGGVRDLHRGTGLEVDGLSEVLTGQGAHSVLATVWHVSDMATARLMERFYAFRAGRHRLGKAAALRKAQLAFLAGGGGSDDVHGRGAARAVSSRRGSVGWAHPYYWAPFVLTGNWQ